MVAKLEAERFSSHTGARIYFAEGMYTFKKPVIITKIPFRIEGIGFGGTEHQVGSRIKIDWENWEGQTWSYDVDGDGVN